MKKRTDSTKRFLAGWPAIALASAIFAMPGTAPLLHAQYYYQEVYDFNCDSQGCNPYDFGQLAQETDGYLYGTASANGQNGVGTIFSVSPTIPGTENDVWQFNGVLAGGAPFSGFTRVPSLVVSIPPYTPSLNLLGATTSGGTYGNGSVFDFLPGSGITNVENYFGENGDTDATAPVQAKDGNFYGIAEEGTTYRITNPGLKYEQLSGTTPTVPVPSTLAAGADGYLYGTSFAGGTSNLGTIFRMSTTGKVTILHSFTGTGKDGSYPAGLVRGMDNNLYGTTEQGGLNGTGTIFQLKFTIAVRTGYVVNTLHSFPALDPTTGQNTNGAQPYAALLANSDGDLYGTTSLGGTNTCGTLFRITTGGAFTKLDEFPNFGLACSGNQNLGPWSVLVQHTNGYMYGTTSAGGSSFGGNVYALAPVATSTPNLTVVAGPIWVKPIDKVTILGENLGETVNVAFAGVQASFQAGSDTYLTAEVPSAAVDGPITVTLTNPAGGEQTLSSQQPMHILPVITNLDPTSGPVGQDVDIVGGGFAGTTKVTFGGVKATAFTVLNPTLIQATVPTGAETGKVTVTTPNGVATSKDTFTVN